MNNIMPEVNRVADNALISVHLPKAAGITLLQTFRKAFPGQLLDVYPDRDPWREVTDTVQVIHGHFELQEYLSIAPSPRVVTFLREPLSRAISHYRFWLNPPNPSATEHPLYTKYFVDQEPSLEKFLLAPEMGNIMSSFLDPFDRPEQFWFVGFQEHFDEDVACLQRMLGLPEIPPPVCNQSKPGTKVETRIAQEVVEQFYEIHAKDKRMYDSMLAFRQCSLARCQRPPQNEFQPPSKKGVLRHKLAGNFRSWRITKSLRRLRNGIRGYQ